MAAPIEASLALALLGILRICFIGLVGWMVLTAVNVTADIYLRRFNLDAEDNLPARKQVT